MAHRRWRLNGIVTTEKIDCLITWFVVLYFFVMAYLAEGGGR